MDNWKTYPLYRPQENKVYTTFNIKGEEHTLLFKNNLWYQLDNSIQILQPIKFKDEN